MGKTDEGAQWFLNGLVLNTRFPQCVRSGYCCKRSACTFGEWDEQKSQCKYLEGDEPGGYFCGIYDEIKDKPGSREISPAFGAGCSSNLNGDRLKLLEEMRDV